MQKIDKTADRFPPIFGTRLLVTLEKKAFNAEIGGTK